MLVRVSHTDADSVGIAFDENQNMITQHLEYEDWAEFMVVWRGRRLELYEDYVSRLQDFAPFTRLLTTVFVRVFLVRSGSRNINTSRSLFHWTVSKQSSLSIRLWT
jgi:hypothetical protein